VGHIASSQLERMVMDVETEIAACASVQAQLEERLARVDSKATLNASRMQVVRQAMTCMQCVLGGRGV
jgi:hypothetical protein